MEETLQTSVCLGYALAYLNSHPEVNKDLTLMVRQLAPTAQGVPIEIYGFAVDKVGKP